MSNREIAIDLIQKLPDTASLHEIAKEIEFVAAVREGFEQLERGEGVPAQDVKGMIPPAMPVLQPRAHLSTESVESIEALLLFGDGEILAPGTDAAPAPSAVGDARPEGVGRPAARVASRGGAMAEKKKGPSRSSGTTRRR